MATATSLVGLMLSAVVLGLVLSSLAEAQRAPPLPSVPAPVCKDKSRYCVHWARQGVCRTHPAHVTAMCPVSCGICPCRDFSVNCLIAAGRSFCHSYPSYMNIECPKACDLCPAGARITTEQTPKANGIVSWKMRFKKKPRA